MTHSSCSFCLLSIVTFLLCSMDGGMFSKSCADKAICVQLCKV